MKLYKTTVTYEVTFITGRQIDTDEMNRLKQKIDMFINDAEIITQQSKIVSGTKEVEV
jgi:hypothetical protein